MKQKAGRNSIEPTSENLDRLFRAKNETRKLDLRRMRLPAVPEIVGEAEWIQELWLDDNLLKNLPDSIGRLSNLTVLSLYKN